jgi:hypothetical protein
MNLLDPLLILFFIICAGIGYRIGIAKSLGYLGSYGVSFVIARLLLPPLYGFIGGIFGENLDFGKLLLFVLIFTLCSLILQGVIHILDHRSFEEKALVEKGVSAGIFSVSSIIFLGIFLVFAEAYIASCSLTTDCISSIEWLHANIESALLTPSLLGLLSAVLKFFIV